jgi:hypothetical protein
MSKLIFPDHGGVLVPDQTKVVLTHKLKTKRGSYTIKVVRYPSPYKQFGYHYLDTDNGVTGSNSGNSHDKEEALEKAIRSIRETEKRDLAARREAKKTPAQKEADRFAKRVAFFEKHAGLGAGVRLANAEVYAEAMGWSVDWEYDEMPYEMGDAEEEPPSEVLVAILRDSDRNVIGSLGGIGDPDSNYRRVVEAELAQEAAPQQ